MHDIGILYEPLVEASGWVHTPTSGVEVLAVDHFKKKSVQEMETRRGALDTAKRGKGTPSFDLH